jgi:hypothetical protein
MRVATLRCGPGAARGQARARFGEFIGAFAQLLRGLVALGGALGVLQLPLSTSFCSLAMRLSSAS